MRRNRQKRKTPAEPGFSVKAIRRLALAELEVLTSLLAAELLTFNGTGVTSHEAFLLEGGLHFGVVGDQGAGNAKTDSAHLAGDSTATSGDFDVPFFRVAEDGERKVGNVRLPVPGFRITAAMAFLRRPVPR